MEREAAVWRYQELHKAAPYHDGKFERWSKDRTLATPYHYSDGLAITVSSVDYQPDDDFLKPPFDEDDDFLADSGSE